MSRLYDRLMCEGKYEEYLNGMVVVAADDVVKYYHETSEQEYWDIGRLPHILPPFDNMFIETKAPLLTNSEDHGETRWSDLWWCPTAWGVGIKSTWLSREKCFVTLLLYLENRHEYCGMFPAALMMDVDRSGRLIDGSIKWGVTKEGIDKNELGGAQGAFIFPLLLSVSFMHCKNETIKQNTPPPKLSRKHQKKHGKPLVRYHTLDIEPMKKILRMEGQSETHGLKHALHICRGHFKDYRDGGGLFGKHKGLYWWESHVRGDKREGVVLKDYNIKMGGQNVLPGM